MFKLHQEKLTAATFGLAINAALYIMTKSEFQTLLSHSSNVALDFARTYVTDNLPNDFRYSVRLNASTDDINLKQFDIYPRDNDKIIDFITADKVINLLNRNGKVPVWIDISVEYVYKGYTVFQLLCAGRYSADQNEFYYLKGETGPFGIKSPTLPIDYIEGVKFNLKPKPKRIFLNG
ncbi:MAG: hypothetical protein KIT80_12060 [Chitinophagaceae bacterium]|nr:hypothetical protein [Chitinophagaceae bacterium]MCW5927637.1 hypothetical protein [Chitinophagaceae bacterium]